MVQQAPKPSRVNPNTPKQTLSRKKSKPARAYEENLTKVTCFSISKRQGALRRRQLTYDDNTLVIWGGDALKERLLDAKFSEIFVIRDQSIIFPAGKSKDSYQLELHPLKFKLPMNLKLSLYFTSTDDREQVFDHVRMTCKAESFKFTYTILTHLSD
mmetsp:Transcript_34624/g.45536  ORF Transcript_34624/g.45536 Transcript_34624/m.45536 type:complete len:157 (-) Transcript_34624:929-1399(-)|eukprot:CAMPEP_0185580356 /NCGR_PEP_ID=MMETSP0434-20130131/16204_1 /TAXON_ID=626734 ORGANISM="Favella taraikaensis, Strain Fe Narragansett Bay" /NCGR_SAMPLE_ID=MMETSP0434 /ASSEMBLY_ACC=CAM_ASM_000379 /LENGTH=156 /DNA_ID=CAMNT_0028198587 /DNA_START=109 /DNA_END=579 /DNA_ORIENTATION=+